MKRNILEAQKSKMNQIKVILKLFFFYYFFIFLNDFKMSSVYNFIGSKERERKRLREAVRSWATTSAPNSSPTSIGFPLLLFFASIVTLILAIVSSLEQSVCAFVEIFAPRWSSGREDISFGSFQRFLFIYLFIYFVLCGYSSFCHGYGWYREL